LAGGVGVPVTDTGWAGIQGTAGLVVNIGLAPLFDLRTGLRVSPGGFPSQEAIMSYAGVPLQARFNLGSVYSIMVGASAGLALSDQYGRTSLGGYAGPEISVLSFRFGAHRQFELSLDQRVLWSFGGPQIFVSYSCMQWDDNHHDSDLLDKCEPDLRRHSKVANVAFFENTAQFTYLFL